MNPADTPFVIEHRRIPAGERSFVPEAKLLLTPALRTSGLLTTLTQESALPLLTLLSFLTPNGRIAPTVHEIGEAIRLSPSGVHDFMEPLTRLHYRESPLAVPRLTESGLEGYLLSPKTFTQVEEALPEQTPEPAGYALAGRDAVIEASRAKYARPRAEVEREIELALGHDPAQSENTPEGAVRRQLYSLGVAREEIDTLLHDFGLEEAQRQLEWLPLRRAKSPARFVAAAIRGRYQAPPGVDAVGSPARAEETLQDSPAQEIPLDDLPDLRWEQQ